jgi:glycosyltransferase involved in cell wall biosynthesis
MRNGVDLQRFQALPREQARGTLGLVGSPLLLSVGNLIELKGHHLVIEAVSMLQAKYPGGHLVIIGDGPERAALERCAREHGVTSRVTFTGTIQNGQLGRWYSAADALVLASRREGWANVLLEAMACGTPVVATKVGGTSEVVVEGVGVLVAERSAASIAKGVHGLLVSYPARAAVRAYAEGFGWKQTSCSQLDLLTRIVATQLERFHA